MMTPSADLEHMRRRTLYDRMDAANGGLCAGRETGPWLDVQIQASGAARLCAGCPVTGECFELAVRQDLTTLLFEPDRLVVGLRTIYAVRGGKTAAVRREEVRRRLEQRPLTKASTLTSSRAAT